MNRGQAGLLLFVTIVPFVGYFLYPFLAYRDSYAWLGGACGLNSVYVLPFVPCNIFLIKVLLLSLYIISVFFIAKWGETVVGEHGWRVGFFSATISPLLFLEALKFENDIFGWSIAFIGLWLFGMALIAKNKRSKAYYSFLGVLAIVFSSFWWEGSLLLLFGVSLSVVYLLVLSVPLFLSKFAQYFTYLTNHFYTTTPIAEELIGAGMLPTMFLFPAILDIPKKWRATGWFLFVIGFIKLKYMLFAVPFLALGFHEFDLKYSKKFERWPNMIIVGLSFSILFGALGFFSAPSVQDFGLIDEAISLSGDLNVPLYNDWKLGWWVEYQGSPTNFKASYPNPDYNVLPRPFVAVTSRDLNCDLVRVAQPHSIYNCK